MRFDISIITADMTSARRPHCETFIEQLKQTHEVDWRFITEAEPNEITPEFIRNNIKLKQLTDPRLEKYNKYSKMLNVRHVSNARKHLAALKNIVNSKDEEDTVYLILEDDILATNNWLENLEQVVRKAPSDYDLVALGIPSNSSAIQELGDPYEVFPCCDSYMVTKKAAKMLTAAFLPLRYVTNVHLAYLVKSLKMRAYLGHPIVFLDGSKYGGFISVLNPGNQLILNSAYMGARRQLVDEKACDPEKLRDIITSLETSPFKQHPDFMHMHALAEWRKNGPRSAKEIFKTALDTYQVNQALINSESQFLRDYISLHKDIQTL